MEIRIHDDFDLKKIADSGQCFRVKEYEDGWFRFIHDTHILYIRQYITDEAESVRESAEDRSVFESDLYEISCTEDEWQTVWHPYFDLDRNYADIRAGIPAQDIFMTRAAQYGRGIRILRQCPWEMLISFIISQRKSIPAIKSSIELLSERFGTTLHTPREALNAFPTVSQLAQATEEDLRECKLGYRAPYILDAVGKVLSSQTDLDSLSDCCDEKLFSELKEVKGVGDKVANCICLFGYGRTGLAPVDTWINKIINEEYSGVNPFPAYKDHAGIMQQYAFYYALSHK